MAHKVAFLICATLRLLFSNFDVKSDAPYGSMLLGKFSTIHASMCVNCVLNFVKCRYEANLLQLEKDVSLLSRKVILVSNSALSKVKREILPPVHWSYRMFYTNVSKLECSFESNLLRVGFLYYFVSKNCLRWQTCCCFNIFKGNICYIGNFQWHWHFYAKQSKCKF